MWEIRLLGSMFKHIPIACLLALMANCYEAELDCGRTGTDYKGTMTFTGFHWEVPEGVYDNASGPDQVLALVADDKLATGYPKLREDPDVFFSPIYENQYAVDFLDPVTLDFDAEDGRLIYNVYLFDRDITKGTGERICRSTKQILIDGGETINDFKVQCIRTANSASSKDIYIDIDELAVVVTDIEDTEVDYNCEDLTGGGLPDA